MDKNIEHGDGLLVLPFDRKCIGKYFTAYEAYEVIKLLSN